MPFRQEEEATLRPAAPLHTDSGADASCLSTAPAVPHLLVHKKPSNLLVRTLTVVFLGPLLFLFGIYSKESCTILCSLGVFIGGLEWSGLKRHLKVALLLSDDNVLNHRERHHKGAAAIAKNGLAASSLPSSPLLASSQTLLLEEYPLPVTPISLYSLLKHMGWAGLAVSAYVSVNAFSVTLAFFFLVFVCVTVMAHNRLERRVEGATARLSHLVRDADKRGQAGQKEKVKLSEFATPERAKKTVMKAQRDYFLSLELQMIAEKQPTEQFLDFCLDIFGILWISGLVYPIFFYNIPRVGVPWGFATLLGNFGNDIMALLVGRSLKAVRQRYSAIYDMPHLPSPSPSPPKPTHLQTSSGSNERRTKRVDGDANADNGAAAKNGGVCGKRPISAANPLLRLVLSGPHPLYAAISPNKSIEGAVAGVITNALLFCASMSITYRYVMPLPDPNILAPGFHCGTLWLAIGALMGVLGVVGDLLQSLLKRAARVKDAGFIVPGHGGILDRLDGCLLVFPFMFCIMNALLALSNREGELRGKIEKVIF